MEFKRLLILGACVGVVLSSASNSYTVEASALKKVLGGDCSAVGGSSLADTELRALRLLAEQASKGIDYRTLGQGWRQGYPTDRRAYREAVARPFKHLASKERSNNSVTSLYELCRKISADAGAARLEIIRAFTREIGAESGSAEGATFEGVLAALESELLMPLRALNEAQSSMHKTFNGHSVPAEKIADTVASITKNVLANTFRQWRYSNSVGRRQLEGLTTEQVARWAEATSTTRDGIRVHEDEHHELGFFWATKIGGPSHGFDIEGQCLLPLLANARHKVVLVSDPAYPHHPVGRAHFRLLWTDDDQPVLWLETLNSDFRLSVNSGSWLRLVLLHVVAKADAIGGQLSCDVGLRHQLSDAVAEQGHKAAVVEILSKRIVLRPSNGVVEASDYLSDKHDWVQLEEETTQPLQRAVYIPSSVSGSRMGIPTDEL